MKTTNGNNPTHKFTYQHDYQASAVQSLSCLERVKFPKALKILTWFLIVSFVLIILALAFIPWIQTSSGSGKITTLDPRDRVQNISALISGRVAQWYVRDGESVKEGDPLVRIQDIDENYVARLQIQLDAANARLAATRNAAETAEIDLLRREQLFNQGLTSRLEYEQARIKVQQLKADEQEVLGDMNQAEMNLSRQGSQLVVAPRDGTVLHVEASDQGTIVSAGDALITFMPANTERVVELYIDGRDIGLVKPGRDVRIEFEGWPAFQFSGMPDFAVGTFAGEVIFVEPSARLDGRFRVLVTEKISSENCMAPQGLPGLHVAGNCGWPPETFIRLGAGTRGWILLEKVPLGYELWRLMNHFPPLNVNALNNEAGTTGEKK